MPRINLSVTSSRNIAGYIEWTESNINVGNNTSDVSASLVYVAPAGSIGKSGWDSSNFYLTINGTTFTYNGRAYISDGETLTIPFAQETKVTVQHDSDGTKSITISGGGYMGTGNVGAISASSGSATVTLSTIDRPSTIGSIVGSTIGSNMRIYINRKSPDFRHSLRWNFGNTTESITGSEHIDSDTSSYYTFAPSLSTFGGQIPNSLSGVMTLTLTTYTDSNKTTQVGSTTQASITLTMPETGIEPQISNFAYTDESGNDLSALIQTISELQFTSTVQGRYGASIASVDFEFEGLHKGAAISGTTATSETFPPISGTSNLRCIVTATDSRGKKLSIVSSTISALPYTPPQLYGVEIVRDTTTPANIITTFTASVSSLTISGTERNSMTCYVLYAIRNSDLPAPAPAYLVSTSGLSVTDATKTYNLNARKSYHFRVEIQDHFNTTYLDVNVPTDAVVLDVRKEGYLGIGKYRERGALDVNGSIFGSLNIWIGGKTNYNDGLMGAALQNYGRLLLQGDSTHAPAIYFYGSSGGTSQTASIQELTDGVLTVSNLDPTVLDIPATETNPSSLASYFPLWTAAATGGDAMANDGLLYRTSQGTANTQGNAILILGNNTASGTAGNKRGRARVYSQGIYYADLVAGSLTSDRTLTLPDKSGTLATLDDIGGGGSYQNADNISF